MVEVKNDTSKTRDKNMKTTSTSKRGSGAPAQDEIATVAYSLYVQNGCVPGHELEDWLRAEQLVSQGKGNGQKTAAHSGKSNWENNRAGEQ